MNPILHRKSIDRLMDTIKLYWEFHKSTLIINWLFSMAISLLGFPFVIFPIVTMTGGPFLSLFYKEIAHKNEYYFYYNRGISKLNLIIVSMIANILTGIILLTAFVYAGLI
ncbi:MAG: hypothetical protein HOO86_08430 [Bacteroidales bacterium]|nr:hypothetical protein [Bacteroidales bacterium]